MDFSPYQNSSITRKSGGGGRSTTFKPWMLWVTLIVIGGLFVLNNPAIGNNALSVLQGKSTPTQSGNLVSVQKTLAITCFDALTGSNCGSVTTKVFFGNSLNSAESGTASNGLYTTSNKYTTGTALTLEVTGNSKVTEYIPFTVPGMDPNSAVSATTNSVVIYAVTLGSWNIVVTGNNGATTFVSGSQYALSGYSGNAVTLTVSALASASNAGYKTSYDITNLLNQYQVFEVNDGGGASSGTQYATVSGFPRQTDIGNTHYYQVICPDGLVPAFGSATVSAGVYVQVGSQSAGSSDSICTGSWTIQTVGTQSFGGTASFSFTVALGSLATGNVQTFQIKVQSYYDPAYFAVNGNGGVNVAQQGATFTIKFNK